MDLWDNMAIYKELIETKTVGAGGVGNIDFRNIPQTYKDLQIVVSCRLINSGLGSLLARVSDLSTSIYSSTVIVGNGSTPSSFRFSSGTQFALGVIGGSDYTAGTFTSATIVLPDYANAARFKQAVSESSSENNAATAIKRLSASLCRSTGAVTSILFFTDNGSFAEGSTISIYGIRNTV
jgi:hypothetical protein